MHVLAARTIAPWNGWSLFLLMVVVGIAAAVTGTIGNRRERRDR